MRRAVLACSVALLAATSAAANETIRPIHERFAEIKPGSDGAEAAADEVPDFRKHVVPLLGRLGCNGRACHGSFQGQGGFRLSLFGYDFKSDHEALAKGDKPRINEQKPLESLILNKPTLSIDHEGGKKYEKNSWEYHVLHRWIAAGAKPVSDSAPDLKRLEITPSEIVFKTTSDTANLRVIAHWSDNTSEDVTALCRFRTNDDAVAKIDPTGKVSAAGVGDTHVVVFYDNGVAPVPVLLPVSDQINERYPDVPTPTKIDELVVAKLRKLGVVPSDLASDEEFLRRVSLDITGTLPPPAEILAFSADNSPDKREKKIDELLERPAYAAWWTTRLCDFTGNNPATMRQQLAPAPVEWYHWIQKRVANNTPYDQIVAGIVSATSRRADQSFDDFCKEMAGYYATEKPGDFADRETMPHYWARQNFRTPDERVMGFATPSWAFTSSAPSATSIRSTSGRRTTLINSNRSSLACGTASPLARRKKVTSCWSRWVSNQIPKSAKTTTRSRTNCARWRLKERSCRTRRCLSLELTSRYSVPKVKKAASESRRHSTESARRREGRPGQTRRSPHRADGLAQAATTPFFARAFVNRVWANYFNVGIIEPADDMNLANPPSNAALLDYLTAGFVDHGYDMKWLHREICRSRTYQLSWQPNETNQLDTRNFSRAVPRRLPAEVAYDAVVRRPPATKSWQSWPTTTKTVPLGSAT